jgi:hypothetical protein
MAYARMRAYTYTHTRTRMQTPRVFPIFKKGDNVTKMLKPVKVYDEFTVDRTFKFLDSCDIPDGGTHSRSHARTHARTHATGITFNGRNEVPFTVFDLAMLDIVSEYGTSIPTAAWLCDWYKMNHSNVSPNARVQMSGYKRSDRNVTVEWVATRAIYPDDEIVFNYCPGDPARAAHLF